MKIRKGFVSNSSSSSFVVLGKNINEENKVQLASHLWKFMNEDDRLTYFPEHSFGWEVVKYYETITKFDWALIMTTCLNDERRTNFIIAINHSLQDYKIQIDMEYLNHIKEIYDSWDTEHAYIDHQTMEKIRNHELFDSEDDIIRFLFSSESYIQNTNDNIYDFGEF